MVVIVLLWLKIIVYVYPEIQYTDVTDETHPEISFGLSVIPVCSVFPVYRFSRLHRNANQLAQLERNALQFLTLQSQGALRAVVDAHPTAHTGAGST